MSKVGTDALRRFQRFGLGFSRSPLALDAGHLFCGAQNAPYATQRVLSRIYATADKPALYANANNGDNMRTLIEWIIKTLGAQPSLCL